MKFAPFSYVRASYRADVFRLMAEAGPDAKVLAGGQSLLASLAFRLSQPPTLIDITRVADFKGVRIEGGRLRIGALTTHRELGASELVQRHAPLLADATKEIAHPAIRNRGTIGGSLAYADPAAELPACLLALDGEVIVASPAGERAVAAQSFFLGLFSVALEANEVIAAVVVPSAEHTGRSGRLVEVARRSGDYAMAGVALTARVASGRLDVPRPVFLGLGDTAVVAEGAAAALHGWSGGEAAMSKAVAALQSDLAPQADQHGSPATKRHLAGVVLARAARALLAGSGARS